MNNQAILERAKRLLALTTSPNENEAAAAAAKLQALLVKHSLEMEGLSLEEALTKREPVGEEVAFTHGKMVRWQHNLLIAVADSHLCEVLYGRSVGGCTHWLVGRPTNRALARMVFDYLRDTVERLSKNALVSARAEGDFRARFQARTWTNSYRIGCVERLRVRLALQFYELRREAEEQAAGVGLARVDAFRAEALAIEAYNRDTYPDLKQERATTPSVDFAAYRAGSDAAGKINLDRQLNAGGEQLALSA